MRALDIALKDLTSAFRSLFAIAFMFVIPILITGMFYLMFGGMGSDDEFSVPETQVVVANLDQGSPDFTAMSTGTEEDGASTLGEMLLTSLQSPNLANLLAVKLVSDPAEARANVDSGQAGVAVIIPADFTGRFMETDGQAEVELYRDPTLTIGPAIVQSVLRQVLDSVSGGRIAVEAVAHTSGPADPALIGQVLQAYLGDQPDDEASTAGLLVHGLDAATPRDNSMRAVIVAPIMGGMLIFYAFYTGVATAQSILREEERRTLPRLFTTPTPQATILTGKFLAVFLTVLVQVVVLLVFARLVFGIQWGVLDHVALVAAGTILTAATFGIFVNSLLKSTRQGGIIYGGVLTVTGMLGMIPIFVQSSGGQSRWAETASLLVPQGWAVRALTQSVNGVPFSDIALTGLVLLGWSAVFFAIGVWRFQKRYA